MTVTYLGSQTLGEILPGAVAASAAGIAGINSALPDILSRIAALQAFLPTPVDFTAQLALATQTLTSIQAGIALGLPVPDISAQIAQVLALVAALLAQVTAINTQLALITDFQSLLSTAGVHAYAYSGQTGNLGAELSAELGGGTPGGLPSDGANGIVLLTTSPTVWVAMSAVFQVTP